MGVVMPKKPPSGRLGWGPDLRGFFANLLALLIVGAFLLSMRIVYGAG